MSEQDQPVEFKLTPKEELAVIVQRLKAHIDDSKDARTKVFLEVACDCVSRAVYSR